MHLCDGNSTTANEVALSTAIMWYAMKHKRDNYADLSVLGFSKSAHGASVATLSCSDASANVGKVPTFDWPVADLPESKMPFARNEAANMAEEERCIHEALQTIE